MEQAKTEAHPRVKLWGWKRIAECLNVHETTARDWWSSGRITVYRQGPKLVYAWSDEILREAQSTHTPSKKDAA